MKRAEGHPCKLLATKHSISIKCALLPHIQEATSTLSTDVFFSNQTLFFLVSLSGLLFRHPLSIKERQEMKRTL